jgi:hypothetical protein
MKRLSYVATPLLDENPEARRQVDDLITLYETNADALSRQVRESVGPLLGVIPDKLENRFVEGLPLELQSGAHSLLNWLKEPVTTPKPVDAPKAYANVGPKPEQLANEPPLDEISNDETLLPDEPVDFVKTKSRKEKAHKAKASEPLEDLPPVGGERLAAFA